MKREDISPHILEGLIGIGYDMCIWDADGDYPDGLGRQDYENMRVDELFASQQAVTLDAKCRCVFNDSENLEWSAKDCPIHEFNPRR